MADIARRNVVLNGRDDRITIVEGDYRRIREWAASGAFAAVYANPPYRERAAVPIAASTASAGPAMKRRRPSATSSMP